MKNLSRNRIVKKIYALLVWMIMLFMITSCSSIRTNDTINGGFENTEGNNPDGWFSNILPQSKKYVEFKLDDKTVHSGDKSILISISKTQPDRQTVYKLVRRVEGLKSPGLYELKGWIKTSSIRNSPYIEVQCWNKSKVIGYASTKEQNPVMGTNSWKAVSASFRIPAGTKKILISIDVTSADNNGGKVWFDDIQLVKVE